MMQQTQAQAPEPIPCYRCGFIDHLELIDILLFGSAMLCAVLAILMGMIFAHELRRRRRSETRMYYPGRDPKDDG